MATTETSNNWPHRSFDSKCNWCHIKWCQCQCPIKIKNKWTTKIRKFKPPTSEIQTRNQPPLELNNPSPLNKKHIKHHEPDIQNYKLRAPNQENETPKLENESPKLKKATIMHAIMHVIMHTTEMEIHVRALLHTFMRQKRESAPPDFLCVGFIYISVHSEH